MSGDMARQEGANVAGPLPADAAGVTDANQLVAVLTAVTEACTALGRADLGERLKLAADRLTRLSSLVCVIGDFKQGKSSLVNALIGRDVCPVDDDVATVAFTAAHAAETSTVRVRRSIDGRPSTEGAALDDVWRFVTERGSVDDRVGVDLVEIGVPSRGLAPGLVLIDTPGVGGLLDQHAAATLGYLRVVDAVVFVADASQELTATEIDFLSRAGQICANLLVVVTKNDLYPAWDRIVELDRERLAARGILVDPVPVSAAVFREGLRRQLPDLQVESGIPRLRELLVERVVEGAQQRSAAHAASEAGWAVERLREPLLAELMVVDDPDRANETIAALRAAEERLQALQAAGARWSTVLNDHFTDLRTDVDHRLRTGTRELLTDVDRQFEDVDPIEAWDGLSRSLQVDLASLVDELFTTIDERAMATNQQMAELLLDASLPLSVEGGAAPRVTDIWGASDHSLRSRRSGFLSSGLTALRGGSSGTILLGMVGRLAGIALATPASIGVAVAFGAKQVIDVRKQEVSRRRQEARTVARRFVEEVSLEAGNRARNRIQEIHRTLRDGYATRVQEQCRSASQAVAVARASSDTEAEARRQRAPRIRGWLEHLDVLLDRLPDIQESQILVDGTGQAER